MAWCPLASRHVHQVSKIMEAEMACRRDVMKKD